MKIELGRKALMSQLGSIGKSRLRLNIGGGRVGSTSLLVACQISLHHTP
jgi:hypothetical protein